eukprot:365894-Chlamydomonas_euryale.AAC.3
MCVRACEVRLHAGGNPGGLAHLGSPDSPSPNPRPRPPLMQPRTGTDRKAASHPQLNFPAFPPSPATHTVQDGHCAQSSTYRGAMDAARRMYLTEGWRAFYNGLTPAWLGSGVAWAAYFYVYESVKVRVLARQAAALA